MVAPAAPVHVLAAAERLLHRRRPPRPSRGAGSGSRRRRRLRCPARATAPAPRPRPRRSARSPLAARAPRCAGGGAPTRTVHLTAARANGCAGAAPPSRGGTCLKAAAQQVAARTSRSSAACLCTTAPRAERRPRRRCPPNTASRQGVLAFSWVFLLDHLLSLNLLKKRLKHMKRCFIISGHTMLKHSSTDLDGGKTPRAEISERSGNVWQKAA